MSVDLVMLAECVLHMPGQLPLTRDCRAWCTDRHTDTTEKYSHVLSDRRQVDACTSAVLAVEPDINFRSLTDCMTDSD